MNKLPLTLLFYFSIVSFNNIFAFNVQAEFVVFGNSKPTSYNHTTVGASTADGRTTNENAEFNAKLEWREDGVFLKGLMSENGVQKLQYSAHRNNRGFVKVDSFKDLTANNEFDSKLKSIFVENWLPKLAFYNLNLMGRRFEVGGLYKIEDLYGFSLREILGSLPIKFDFDCSFQLNKIGNLAVFEMKDCQKNIEVSGNQVDGTIEMSSSYDIATGLAKSMEEKFNFVISDTKFSGISGRKIAKFIYSFKQQEPSFKNNDIVTRLKKLKKLEREGLITKEEAARKRQELLDKL